LVKFYLLFLTPKNQNLAYLLHGVMKLPPNLRLTQDYAYASMIDSD
jgi:hypothetical protein